MNKVISEEVYDECKEDSYKPICISCYTKELFYWLRENINNEIITAYVLRESAKRTSPNNLGPGYCIICKKPSLFVCEHCYIENVKKVLSEINVTSKIIKNFVETF